MASPLPPVPNLGCLADLAQDRGATWLIELGADGVRREFSFGELDDLSNALARGLRGRKFPDGARIGILAENSARYLISYLAIMRGGFCAVPINHRLPDDRIAYIHDDADIALTFCDGAHADRAPRSVPHLRLDTSEWEGALDAGPFTPAEHDAEAIANILYTSGSTGVPKGVPLTHHGYGYSVQASLAGLGRMPEARILVSAPLYHMNGLFMSKLCVACGATQVLLRKFDPRAYLRAIAEERCTIVTGIPTMIALALRERDLLDELNFDHVSALLIGSSPVTPDLVAQIGRVFPNASVTVTYGTTESGPTAFAPHPDGRPTPPTALGVASPYAEVRLVGGASDAQGVLWVRSPVVMPGYLNQPAKTAEVLQDGWYNTGDVMRRDAAGFYYFVDRADDMFVSAGENIHPGDVEVMLARHPDILEVCVVPMPDALKGALPVAFVVARPASDLTPDQVRDFALKNGPAYAHPRVVEFVDRLPWQGTNKVDRKTLLERARAFERVHSER